MTQLEAGAGVVPDLTLGWRLQIALRHAGLSVQDMATEFGMARGSLSRWVNDKGAPPRPVFVKQWALRTGVSFDWLMHGKAGPGPEGWAPRGSNPQPTDYKAAVPDLASRRSQLLRRVIVPLRRAA